MFFVQEGFTYRNFLMDMIAVFAFVVWFWLLVVIYGDLFRRHDIGGWGKALWVLALVLTSYFGIFAYLITQGRGMAERNAQQAERARDELRHVVGFSVADEITKLDQLKKSRSITDVPTTVRHSVSNLIGGTNCGLAGAGHLDPLITLFMRPDSHRQRHPHEKRRR